MPPAEQGQVAYARSVLGLLWPSPAVVGSTRRPSLDAGGRAWLLLPSPSRPTLLVPVDTPAAARMLQRHGSRLLPRVARAGLAWSVRTGVLARLPTPRLTVAWPSGPVEGVASVEDHLRAALPGTSRIGLLLGTPRANRKPVLQLFDDQGVTLAFVKVGVDALTCALVRQEAANLEVVHAAAPTTVQAPEVLHLGRFAGLDLLALSPLGSSQQRRTAQLPTAAMTEISRLAGVEEQRLTDSRFWARTADVVDGLGDRPGARELREAVSAAGARWGGEPVRFGCWHGDWAPWNMGVVGGRVQLWDWERFAADVPLGFDAVHYRAQRVRHDAADVAAQEAALLAELPELLTAVDADPGTAGPRLPLVLYLLEVSGRYLGMGDGSGPAHPRARWALDLADRLTRDGD